MSYGDIEISIGFRKKFFEFYASRENCHGEFSLKKPKAGEKKKAWTVKKPLTLDDVTKHLNFNRCLGGHPQLLDNTCKRIGFDIDSGKMQDKTKLIVEILKLNGFKPFISWSGGKTEEGEHKYHIDVFFNTPLSWNDTFQMGQQIKNFVGDIEVFPKQGEGANYGNWLKFPLGKHPLTRVICYFLDNDLKPVTPRERSIKLLEKTDVSKIDVLNLTFPERKIEKKKPPVHVKSKEPLVKGEVPFEAMKIRPCFKKAYADNWKMTGDDGHLFRQAAVREISISAPKISNNEIATYFENQADYNREITMRQIGSIVGKYDKPFRCLSLQNLLKVREVCKVCPIMKKRLTPTKDKKKQTEEEKTRKYKSTSFYNDGRKIYEIIADPLTYKTSFAIWDTVGKCVEYSPYIFMEDEENNTEIIIQPYKDSIISKGVIILPSEAHPYGTEKMLIHDIRSFIHRYIDVPPLFESLISYYVLFTWLFDRFTHLPYIRTLGDYGTGKTRIIEVLGKVSYKAIFCGGATTPSPLFRVIEKYGGTLVMDEGDFKFSDADAEIIKILNCGYMKGMPVLRSERTGSSFEAKAYDVYAPKLLATRKTFKDHALESRCLTHHTTSAEPRSDIPTMLPETFADEALELRNKLLMFRFHKYHRTKIRLDSYNPKLERRINQITMPLLSIIEDEDALKDVRAFISGYAKEVLGDRTHTLTAEILEAIIDRMIFFPGENIKKYDEYNMHDLGVKDLTDAINFRLSEKERISAKRMGAIIRKSLNLNTVRGRDGYYFKRSDQDTLRKTYALAKRFGYGKEGKKKKRQVRKLRLQILEEEMNKVPEKQRKLEVE